MSRSIPAIRLEHVEAAASRIRTAAARTPLLPLDLSDPDRQIWLKLECLQPIGSFKIRGAANALALADPERVRHGVYTGSAGNMAQGVAYCARQLGVPCRVILPNDAPRAKVDAIRRLGAEPVPVPFDEWWRVLVEHGHPDEEGFFIHPVADEAVIAGNGTIGLEIIEELPSVDTIVAPFGGGGLSCGIASAVRELKPSVEVFAAEVETAAPLRASLSEGGARSIERTPTFVDGIGGSAVLPEMWPMASTLLAGAIVTSLDDVCAAIRELATDVGVIAEGAAGAAVAAARAPSTPGRAVVAVVSGGNIDRHVLAAILRGQLPTA